MVALICNSCINFNQRIIFIKSKAWLLDKLFILGVVSLEKRTGFNIHLQGLLQLWLFLAQDYRCTLSFEACILHLLLRGKAFLSFKWIQVMACKFVYKFGFSLRFDLQSDLVSFLNPFGCSLSFQIIVYWFQIISCNLRKLLTLSLILSGPFLSYLAISLIVLSEPKFKPALDHHDDTLKVACLGWLLQLFGKEK